jgi:hypothetical protein
MPIARVQKTKPETQLEAPPKTAAPHTRRSLSRAPCGVRGHEHGTRLDTLASMVFLDIEIG